MKIGLILALSLPLVGCGSSELASLPNASVAAPVPASSPVASRFAGRIVLEQGAPASRVDVVLHERTSDRKHTALTGADGTFTLDLPAGVYDLGLNSAVSPMTPALTGTLPTRPGTATG